MVKNAALEVYSNTIGSRVVASAAKIVDQSAQQCGTSRAPGVGLETIDLTHAVVGVGVFCHLTGNRFTRKWKSANTHLWCAALSARAGVQLPGCTPLACKS